MFMSESTLPCGLLTLIIAFSLFCPHFSSLQPIHYYFFSHRCLTICTFWSLGSNKCHNASFTLTSSQFLSCKMLQLRYGLQEAIYPTQALAVVLVVSLSTEFSSYFSFSCYFFLYTLICQLSRCLSLTLTNYHISRISLSYLTLVAHSELWV